MTVVDQSPYSYIPLTYTFLHNIIIVQGSAE